MAEDIWRGNPGGRVLNNVRDEIVTECERLQENCLYTSTELFIWLRALRAHRRIFIFMQLLFSVLAGGFAFAGNAILAGGFGAIAGLSPMVWDALKMDGDISLVEHHASLFVELRDRFRQIRLIEDARGIDALERAFEDAKADLAAARKSRVTAPERFYQMAKDKIHSGDYNNAVDDDSRKLANETLPP